MDDASSIEQFLAAMAKGPSIDVGKYSSKVTETPLAPFVDGTVVADDGQSEDDGTKAETMTAQTTALAERIGIASPDPDSAANFASDSPRPSTRDHIQQCEELEDRMRADRENLRTFSDDKDTPQWHKDLEDRMKAEKLVHPSDATPIDPPQWNADVEDKMKAYRPVDPPKAVTKDYPQWYTHLEDRMKVYRSVSGVDTKNPRDTQSYSPIPQGYVEACNVARDSIKEVLENYSLRSRPSSSKEPSPQRKLSKLNLPIQQPISPPNPPTDPEAVHDEAFTLPSPPAMKSKSTGLSHDEPWIAPHLRIPKAKKQTFTEVVLHSPPFPTVHHSMFREHPPAHVDLAHHEKPAPVKPSDSSSERLGASKVFSSPTPQTEVQEASMPTEGPSPLSAQEPMLSKTSDKPIESSDERSQCTETASTLTESKYTTLPDKKAWIGPHLRVPRTSAPKPDPLAEVSLQVVSSKVSPTTPKHDDAAGEVDAREAKLFTTSETTQGLVNHKESGTLHANADGVHITSAVELSNVEIPGKPGSEPANATQGQAWIPPHLRAPNAPQSQLSAPPNTPSSVRTEKIADGSALVTAVDDVVPLEHGLDGSNRNPKILPVKIEEAPVPKQADIAPSIKAPSTELERDSALYFSSWGAPQQRDRVAARTRKVILTSTPAFDNPCSQLIASLVFGGPLEQILTTSNSASVTFLNADDCRNYYNATANGIKYGQSHVADVRLSNEVDVIGGRLQALIDKEATRCVRAVGKLSEEQSKQHLLETMARGRMTRERKVERILKEKNARGVDSVTWRFCDIRDAETFTTELRRDENWEHCNIHYAPDPCALAKGVHVD